MTGLEKMKAKAGAGEVSSSARAMSLQDIRRLHGLCFNVDPTVAEQRWGIVRYVCVHSCSCRDPSERILVLYYRQHTCLHGYYYFVLMK